jgi:carbon monoxide dehydrogenase subunit G
MTNFEQTITIHQPVQIVYDFLKDLSNHKHLMPDNVLDWTATVDEAKFTIKNMTTLGIAVKERIENQSVIALPTTKVPFDLSFEWKVNAVNENQTTATLTIKAELNMMLKMVASGPLQKLVDYQVKSLGNKFN